jgi:hypothetical protein
LGCVRLDSKPAAKDLFLHLLLKGVEMLGVDGVALLRAVAPNW